MVLSWWRRRLKRLSRPILTAQQSVPGTRCVHLAVETLEDRVVPAGTFTWVGRVSGFWSDGRNWAAGSAPTARDRNDTLNFVPTSGFTNTTDNIPNLISPQIIVTGVYTLNQLPASATITVGNRGALTVGGTVGPTTVQTGGTLIPPLTPTLKVQGNLTLQPGSTFRALISSASNFSNVVVTGTATVGGSSLALLDPSGAPSRFIPNPTDELALISSSNPVSGQFANYPEAQLQPTLARGGALYFSYNSPDPAHPNSVILHGPDDHILYVYALFNALQRTDPAAPELTNSSGQVTDFDDLGTIYNAYLANINANGGPGNQVGVDLARDPVARDLVDTVAYRKVEVQSFFKELGLTPTQDQVTSIAPKLNTTQDWFIFLQIATSGFARQQRFSTNTAFIDGLFQAVLGTMPRGKALKGDLARLKQEGRFAFGQDLISSTKLIMAGVQQRVGQILGRSAARNEERYLVTQILNKGLDADTLDVVLLAGSPFIKPSAPVTFRQNGPPITVTQDPPTNFGDELLKDYKTTFTPPPPLIPSSPP